MLYGHVVESRPNAWGYPNRKGKEKEKSVGMGSKLNFSRQLANKPSMGGN
jgi:hypothetical protein